MDLEEVRRKIQPNEYLDPSYSSIKKFEQKYNRKLSLYSIYIHMLYKGCGRNATSYWFLTSILLSSQEKAKAAKDRILPSPFFFSSVYCLHAFFFFLHQIQIYFIKRTERKTKITSATIPWNQSKSTHVIVSCPFNLPSLRTTESVEAFINGVLSCSRQKKWPPFWVLLIRTLGRTNVLLLP